MKIFQKTFMYTLVLLVLIALLASWLIYTLMPTFYTKQKQRELTFQAEQLVQKLSSAKREDIVSLISDYAGGQTNIIINIGEEKYALITWSNPSGSDLTLTSYVSVSSTSITGSDDMVFNVAITDVDSVKGNGIKISEGDFSPVLYNFSTWPKQLKHSAISQWITNPARLQYL